MIKKYLMKPFVFALLTLAICFCSLPQLHAQVNGPQVTKWIRVNALHQWFSNGCAEIEYGRRSRAFLAQDQVDGLRWPGEFTNNKGVNVGKSLWIGTTNFHDPIDGNTYPYKVICAGRPNMNLNSEIWPIEFTEYGKFELPTVLVDNQRAADIEFDDNVDVFDPTMAADRMIVNTINTPIGITVTRKILAFTQQYHDNYFIYEYTFKNTGLIDNAGTSIAPRSLKDVVFHFQYRYGFAGEGYFLGWRPTGSEYGLNTINDVVGHDAAHTLPAPNDFRAVFAYYGPFTGTPGVLEDIGSPRYTDGSILAGTDFAGVVVLHADKSPADHSDDPRQPFDTRFMGSDNDAQSLGPYSASLMTQKYQYMTEGHPSAGTQAEQIGKDSHGWPSATANNWGGDTGGYASAQGFGPYNMENGDSIKIVVAEAVAGIMKNRDFVKTVARKWFTNTGPFVLPDGSTTTDRNIYKDTWVFTGKDSLFQSFRRAIANYKSGYNIPQPPPAPNEFRVESGGNRIKLSWASNAQSWPNFNGYQIFRAEGRTDTMFTKIWECDKNNVVNSYDDKTARRGFYYYYYIQTKDDGSTNDIQPGVPLVSSRYITMTSAANGAQLQRLPGTKLDEIRVVPNPYVINSRGLEFGASAPDRLAFYGLPPFCDIKIYTETGDLIETIHHTSSSGDELWESLTSSRQLVVSGLYIAYFEVTQDTYDDQTNALLFKKGDNIIRKFIIIR